MSITKNRFISTSILSLIILAGCFIPTSEAQKLKIMASNTFNGAMTGGLLGGATMALQNSDNFDPVRFGVGLGTLSGVAIGAHDVAKISEGERYLIDGTFNSGHATTVIILLDTIYGGATGAIVGTAISLMLEDPIIEGIQYGSGAGLWGGFFFGMMDAFYLSSQKTTMTSSLHNPASTDASSWLTVQQEQTRISFLQPQFYSFKKATQQTISRETGMSISMLEVSVQL